MAELDIKDIWKKGTASVGSTEEINVEEMIAQKPHTVLNKIKFILKIEFWLNNLVNPAAAIFYFLHIGFWSGFIVAVGFAIYFIYYLFLIGAINKFDYSEDVKHSLTKVYKYPRFYLLHYKVIIWLTFVGLSWGCFLYGMYIGYTGEKPDWIPETGPKFEFTKTQVYVVIAMVIIIPVVTASALHYLINLLYGRKIAKLRRIVSDFNEQ